MVALNLQRLKIWKCCKITLKQERKVGKMSFFQRHSTLKKNKRMSGAHVKSYRCQGPQRDSTQRTLNWNFPSPDSNRAQWVLWNKLMSQVQFLSIKYLKELKISNKKNFNLLWDLRVCFIQAKTILLYLTVYFIWQQKITMCSSVSLECLMMTTHMKLLNFFKRSIT